MTTVAVVPARGGSKGLPGKNLAEVGGRSLVARAVAVALAVEAVDDVVVTSDDRAILDEGRSAGARAISRPAELATDSARMEDVLLHVLRDAPGVTNVVVLQPTSPLRIAEDVARTIAALATASTAATACRLTHPAEWTFRLADGKPLPLAGWEGFSRRRQDLPEAYQLNGAVYAAVASHLLGGGSLFDPHTAIVEMPSLRSIDIDTQEDLDLARIIDGMT